MPDSLILSKKPLVQLLYVILKLLSSLKLLTLKLMLLNYFQFLMLPMILLHFLILLMRLLRQLCLQPLKLV